MGTTHQRKSADEGREGGNAIERESEITPTSERDIANVLSPRDGARYISFYKPEEARSPIHR